MRAPADVGEVLRLAREGRTATEVARFTGIPRSTVRDWMRGALPRAAISHPGAHACVRCQAPEHDFGSLGAKYMYALGVFLGDGCISAHARGVFKLRLFLDARYPAIVDECERAVRALAPQNRVNRLLRRGGYENSS